MASDLGARPDHVFRGVLLELDTSVTAPLARLSVLHHGVKTPPRTEHMQGSKAGRFERYDLGDVTLCSDYCRSSL